MQNTARKNQVIYIIYWSMLAYTIAALVFWFVSLNKQNKYMTGYKLSALSKSDPAYDTKQAKILNEQKRKTTQYLGEGITFFLVLMGGAIFIFRSVRRQLKQSVQEQNFMMAITHELKTPIAVAQLNLETLQKRKLDEVQQQRLIHNTLQETIRLNTLCNNLLFSTQIDAGGYRLMNDELNFSELVINCVNDYSVRYPQKPINQNIPEGIYTKGDNLLLQMALNNLVDNAIKYSPKQSALNISLEQNSDIKLKIADEGSGISDEDKKKVFDKFYRAGNAATKSAKGTGLGLYLTCKVISEHHGSISVTDNIPAGSVFTVCLRPA